MEFDFNALINTVLLAKIDQKSPQAAKVFNIFAKRGINAIDAMAMLLEICAIAEEMENADEQGKAD